MGTLSSEDWTKFWNAGRITTFGSGFMDNYDGDIAEFWSRQLADTQGHIIDLCCGNGALVWLVDALAKTHKKELQITGVDIADINPFKLLNRLQKNFPMVKFIGNTSIEALPFENGSINVAISQFGIEYSNTEKTLREMNRVLSSNGKLAFIVHRDDSTIIEGSKLTMARFRQLVDGGEFEHALFSLDDLFNQSHNFNQIQLNPKYTSLMGTLNRLSYHAHRSHITTNPGYEKSRLMLRDHLATIAKLFDGSSPIRNRKRRAQLEQWLNFFHESINRIEDLIAAALPESKLIELRKHIEDNGFKLTVDEPFYYSAEKLYIGHTFVAERV